MRWCRHACRCDAALRCVRRAAARHRPRMAAPAAANRRRPRHRRLAARGRRARQRRSGAAAAEMWAAQRRCGPVPLQWSVKRRGCVCDARARRQAARFVHTHACILLHAGDRAVLKFGGAAELLRTFNVSADALVERFVACVIRAHSPVTAYGAPECTVARAHPCTLMTPTHMTAVPMGKGCRAGCTAGCTATPSQGRLLRCTGGIRALRRPCGRLLPKDSAQAQRLASTQQARRCSLRACATLAR